MIRLKTIRKFKCPIAICGIFAFAIVISCELFCNVGLISFSFSQPVAVSTSHNHKDQQPNDIHHDNKNSHGGHDHGTMAGHHDQSSGEGGCCDDLTQLFYFSLTHNTANNTALVHVQLSKVLSTLFLEQATVLFVPVDLSHTEFQHLPKGPPGINGRILRVLISSFLI